MEAQKKARNGKVKVEKKDSGPKILPLDKMVESSDEPIEIDSVVRVVLKGLVVNNVKYWVDSDSGKLYKRLAKGNIIYVGRWDGEAISEGADSDED